jgi:pyrimidine deaminase RibD-like protein
VIDPRGRKAAAVNYFGKSGKRVHAERAAVEKYEHEHGELPEGSVIVTTLSPCSEPMPERAGISCSELLNDLNISRAYCGYMDPTQDALRHENFDAVATQNEHIQHVCKEIADCFLKESGVLDPANYRGESITEAGPFNSRQEVINYFVSRGRTAAEGAAAWDRGWRGHAAKTTRSQVKPYDPNKYKNKDDLDENFADGRVKGKSRPGRVARAGASCAGSVTSLRQKARQGGEKGKMYHWCANMKAGRKK